jgi:hypothetical protein
MKMFTSFIPAAVMSVILFSANLGSAQGLSGTYKGKSKDSGDLTLQITQSGNTIAGSFTSFRTVLQLTGTVANNLITGTATLANTPLRFFIHMKVDGVNALLEVTEEGENHQPDSATREQFVLLKQGGAPTANATAPAGAGSSPSSPSSPASPASARPASPAGSPQGNPLASRDLWPGVYENESIAMEVKPDGGGYQGAITLQGQSYPFTAQKSANGIAGNFKAGGQSYTFSAKLSGDAMTLSSDGATYTLNRRGGSPSAVPVNPLAAAHAPAKAQVNAPKTERIVPSASTENRAQVSSPSAGWKTLHHPIGISVHYPGDWTTQTISSGSYRLMPPDSKMDGGQPAEAYFILGAPAENIARPDNPQLIQLLEAQVLQLAPFLQRTGAPQSVSAGTLPGMLMQWKGTNQIGKPVSARLYVTIVKGAAVCVFGLGYQDNLAQRESALRGIFTSFASGEASMDPQVAGVWILRDTRTMDAAHSMQKTSSSSETHASLVLQPNGQAQRKETYQMMANSTFKNSGGQQTSTIFLDSGPQTTIKNGRWMAGEGRLVLMYDNGGGDEYKYQVQGGPGGRQLILSTDNGRQEIWGESR